MQTELQEKRTLNAKIFNNGDGTLTMDAHVGHIHYKNKFGLGDGNTGFRSLDWTLAAKETGGWEFVYHSFQPSLPQFADNWLYFRDVFEDKDQTVGFKAVCNHVEGRLVKVDELEIEGLAKMTSVNCVIYDNAFVDGIDLIIYFERSAMKKCVRIRKKEVKVYTFDFELSLPGNATVSRVGDTKYEVDLATSKDFDTEKTTEIQTDKGITYFRPFRVWDNKKSEVITVSYIVDGGKKILRKHIPADFMGASVGDVFTDTTTSYYTGASDTAMYKNTLTSWADTRGAVAADVNQPTGTYGYTETGFRTGSKYLIWRLFLPIDTSLIPGDATISGATLKVFDNNYRYDTDQDAYDWITVVEGSPTDPTSVVVGDFAKKGTTEGIDIGDRLDIPTYTLNQYQTFVLNSIGMGWISKVGYTTFVLLEGHDFGNGTPSSTIGSDTGLGIYTSEYGSNQPYLSVTYTIASSESIKLAPSGGAAYGGVGMY